MISAYFCAEIIFKMYMKRLVAGLIIALFVIGANAQTYYSMVDSAETCIMSKDWAKAEEWIQKALKAEPDNSSNSLLLSNLATVQRYQGKKQDALRNYSLAIYMTPNAVTLLKNRASLYVDVDSVDLAYADYEKIISLDSKDIESLYNHGMIALGKKKMGVSKDDFDRIAAISPKSFYAINGKATWNKLKGNYQQAADAYGKIIKARPSAEAYVNRAECYLALKKLNEAEADIRNAVELDPKNGYIYVLRAKFDKMRYDDMALKRDLELAEKYGVKKSELKNLLK